MFAQSVKRSRRCAGSAFRAGHVCAFGHLGGVVRRCIYDNVEGGREAAPGVGQERELSDRFLALCSHYVIEPCFAGPGEGHDKGGVEARGKNVRLQHLTPDPVRRIAGRDRGTAGGGPGRRTGALRSSGQGGAVAERFLEERAVLARAAG